MAEFVTKRNIIKIFIQIIPLFTLFLKWVDILGITEYAGIVYVYRNKVTCILGFIIILVEIFLKFDWKYKFGINLLGNLIFWVPLFYTVLNQTKNIRHLTGMFYISIAIVCLSCILQLKMIYANKLETA